MPKAKRNGLPGKKVLRRSHRNGKFDRDDLLFRVDITMAADVASISPLVDAVAALVHQAHCSQGKEFEVETALREALANAVVHGCSNDCRKLIQCSVACDRSHGLLIVVRDPGAGFDPESIPKPTAAENLHSTHGRGIFLIQELMDDVHFERGGREIHMRKH